MATKISLLVICLIIALSGIVFITKSGTIENKVTILDKLSKDDFKGEKGDFYSVRIDIVNKTDSTVSFCNMSCSWDCNFISSRNSILGIYNRGCDKNELKVIHLNSGEKQSYFGVIQVLDPTLISKREKVKLGFILIKESEISSRSSFRNLLKLKRSKVEDVIWSNSFHLE